LSHAVSRTNELLEREGHWKVVLQSRLFGYNVN
jgi:hypothetical protein